MLQQDQFTDFIWAFLNKLSARNNNGSKSLTEHVIIRNLKLKMASNKKLQNMSITRLPENVLLEIFRYLQVKELCIVCRVCRSWRRIANDNAMWRHVDMTPYKLNLHKMWKVIRAHFSDVLLSLHLKGYHEAGSANLMKNSLSEAMMKDLQERCPNIRTLRLVNNHFTKVHLEQFPQKLQALILTSCFIPANWFKLVAKKGLLPELRVLDLSSSVKTSDADIKDICGGWKDLTTLRLNGCYRVTSTALEDISKSLIQLRTLETTEINCSDLALHHICRNLKDLERLVIAGTKSQNSSMSSESVRNSVTTLPKLDYLDISYSEIDDTTLQSLTTVKSLSHVNVSHTKVTKSGILGFQVKHVGGKGVDVITELRLMEPTSDSVNSSCGGDTLDY